ncbi:uncharacterized protein AMSG_09126 [Thecamonas trahens ATCC 50062]|uniref:Uncharacterized protein n=1 Tax=Thecamonas trahens ATCC 50062 TaxID=461836 RepID=A0A0L0DLN6_THETB|nr:hypothetical protein AMSG_09126 [Thecamonas trahens ATCC 50062]KNC52956.1 hypothetical protein AMSG_09126 [Thecamonas trahens ATCC 50062]|eukprot:XP_013754849.1 hypothetical protein AMSG_09126 [Thecamonas trahens ATCC 50062]
MGKRGAGTGGYASEVRARQRDEENRRRRKAKVKAKQAAEDALVATDPAAALARLRYLEHALTQGFLAGSAKRRVASDVGFLRSKIQASHKSPEALAAALAAAGTAVPGYTPLPHELPKPAGADTDAGADADADAVGEATVAEDSSNDGQPPPSIDLASIPLPPGPVPGWETLPLRRAPPCPTPPRPMHMHPAPHHMHPAPHHMHPAPHRMHPAPHRMHPAPHHMHPAPQAKRQKTLVATDTPPLARLRHL